VVRNVKFSTECLFLECWHFDNQNNDVILLLIQGMVVPHIKCVLRAQLIQNKFSEFQLGIEAGSQRFERVDKMATALVEEENPKSTLILERQEDLR